MQHCSEMWVIEDHQLKEEIWCKKALYSILFDKDSLSRNHRPSHAMYTMYSLQRPLHSFSIWKERKNAKTQLFGSCYRCLKFLRQILTDRQSKNGYCRKKENSSLSPMLSEKLYWVDRWGSLVFQAMANTRLTLTYSRSVVFLHELFNYYIVGRLVMMLKNAL